jgi:hypothetical protein
MIPIEELVPCRNPWTAFAVEDKDKSSLYDTTCALPIEKELVL